MTDQLPADIAEAIEALRNAEHRHGSAYLSGGSREYRAEQAADRAAYCLERLIVAHIAEATSLGRSILNDERG